MRAILPALLCALTIATASASDADVPGLLVTKGTRDIATARLTGPSPRYAHGVFGSKLEMTGIALVTRDGRNVTFSLDSGSVFEDREIRLADLDGDERDEMVVVQTDLKTGSSLAVYGLEEGRIVLRAKTPALGAPNRWLNPAGIGNFKGDGPLIAFVRQPHAVGELQLWRYARGALTREGILGDVSDHKFGSQQRHLAAVVDWNGDGKADLAIASFNRRAVRIIGFGTEPYQIARFDMPGEITGNFRVTGTAASPEIEIGLADGKLVRVHPGGIRQSP